MMGSKPHIRKVKSGWTCSGPVGRRDVIRFGVSPNVAYAAWSRSPERLAELEDGSRPVGPQNHPLRPRSWVRSLAELRALMR